MLWICTASRARLRATRSLPLPITDGSPRALQAGNFRRGVVPPSLTPPRQLPCKVVVKGDAWDATVICEAGCPRVNLGPCATSKVTLALLHLSKHFGQPSFQAPPPPFHVSDFRMPPPRQRPHTPRQAPVPRGKRGTLTHAWASTNPCSQFSHLTRRVANVSLEASSSLPPPPPLLALRKGAVPVLCSQPVPTLRRFGDAILRPHAFHRHPGRAV